MAEAVAIEDLEARTRRLLRIARRTEMAPEEVAQDALRLFSAPAQIEQQRSRMSGAVEEVAARLRTAPLMVLGAVVLPPGRAAAFEAAEAAKSFRRRLEQRRGAPFPDSTPLIREDRER